MIFFLFCKESRSKKNWGGEGGGGQSKWILFTKDKGYK